MDTGTTTPTSDAGTTMDPDADTTPPVPTDTGTAMPADSGMPPSDSGTGTPDTGTTTDRGTEALTGFEMVVRADCEAAHRCRSVVTEYYPEATDADFVAAFGSSVTGCISMSLTSDGRVALRDAVNRGTVIYDGGWVAACVSGMNTMTCNTFWTAGEPLVACDNVLEGTLPNGSSCTINGECISGACTGVCSPPE
jgi:hypothetical protein